MNLLDKIDAVMTNRRRKYLYGVATAGLAALLAFGLLTGEQVAALAGLASAVTGLAFINTPDRGDHAVADTRIPQAYAEGEEAGRAEAFAEGEDSAYADAFAEGETAGRAEAFASVNLNDVTGATRMPHWG